MKETKLLIGKIPYANLFPIYHYLEEKCDNSDYKFISGVPSKLNRMMRDGKIDVSPSSSIEYLKHKNKYSVIPWLSVSASGPVCSIFLFSKYPIEELHNKTIAVSSHSETSAVLLKIILKEFLSFRYRFKVVDHGTTGKILKTFPACLLIGDEAMKEAKKHSGVRCQVSGVSKKLKNKNHISKAKTPLYIYDLGELWHKHTGLPFVFALWIVRKKILGQKKELIKKLSSDLISAKKYASRHSSQIADLAPQRKWLTRKELIAYWKGISYNFTDKHMEGLRLFEKYAKKS